MLLAGSFREYPFFLLLEIFLRRRETGLLEVVASPEESGYFYIRNGKIKDGQIGKCKGAAAVKLVGRFVDGSFRFKPLEPTDYARVVWQQSFGPNALSAEQPGFPATIRNKLGQLRSYPAAASHVREQAVASTAQRALRTFLLYTLATNHSLQKSGLSLLRRTVATVTAGLAVLKEAQIGTRLMLPFATARDKLGEFRSDTASVYKVSKEALASSAQRGLRQFLSYTSAAWHSLRKSGPFLQRRILAWATAGAEFWKRAPVRTKRLGMPKSGFAKWQGRRRSSEQLKSKSPRNFQVPLPSIPKRVAIAAAFKGGIENNLTFTIIMIVLWSFGGLLIYQIVRSQEPDQRITVDDNFDIQESPAKAPRTRTKRKGRGARKPSADNNSNVGSLNERGNLPQIGPADSEADDQDDQDISKGISETTPEVHSIPVVLQIENGRVSQANVLTHRPGMENAEAAALEIARQRRYYVPGKYTETIVVRVMQSAP
jgi:hypothetical protein